MHDHSYMLKYNIEPRLRKIHIGKGSVSNVDEIMQFVI